MNSKKQYAGIDYFRIAAAFLIIGIHTAPFEKINETADYLITYCFGRTAVPFFLMVTGYFVLGKKSKIKKYLLRTFLMYLGVTLLYLPIIIYAKQLPKGVGEWLKWFFIDGTFYHLWYLPAALLGVFVTAVLIRYTSIKISGICIVLLYIIGLFGDSYYGLIQENKLLAGIYDGIFTVSSYTRNGIFYAPMFLWIGYFIRRQTLRREKELELERKGKFQTKASAADSLLEKQEEFLIARRKRKELELWITGGLLLVALLAEGLLTWEMEWQRHNSMYLLLPPVMYCFMKILLEIKGQAPSVLRSISMWIYLLHPLWIIAVRGIVKFLKLPVWMVENPLLLYIEVCLISFVAAIGIVWLLQYAIYFRKRKIEDVSKRESLD